MLGVVTLGNLMGSIDSTILIVAFPQIARDLQASLVDMVWVLIIYILVGTALVMSFGRMADLWGRRRFYLAGFVLFLVGSALCGLAPSVADLIAFRGIQGVGAALLLANSFAVLSDTFPAGKRGSAFGINSTVWGLGAIVGVAAGGLVLSFASWRWIFWVNIPIGIVATALAISVIPESDRLGHRETFDLPAAGMFTSALALVLFGLTSEILGGWDRVETVGPLVASALLLLGFVLWERAVSTDPILPLGLLRSRLVSASLIALVLQGVALFSANFLLMAYLQGIRGFPVLEAASLLAPMGFTLAVIGPLGGRLSDRLGARGISSVGLLVQGSALVLLSTLTASSALWTVAVIEALLGAGGGLFYPANAAAIMGAVPRARHGVAAGTLMTARNSSIAISLAVGLAVLTTQAPVGMQGALVGGAFTPTSTTPLHLTSDQLSTIYLHGMSLAFRLGAGLMWVGAIFSAIRGRERRSASVRPLEARRHPTQLGSVPEHPRTRPLELRERRT